MVNWPSMTTSLGDHGALSLFIMIILKIINYCIPTVAMHKTKNEIHVK